MQRNLNKCWKILGGGVTASCLLATGVVAPLTSNKYQIKQFNSNSQNQISINSTFTSLNSDTISLASETTNDTIGARTLFNNPDIPNITITYTSDNSAITIVGVSEQIDATGEDLNMIDDIDGIPITAIGDDAFYDDETGEGGLIEFNSLSLPKNLISIGANAFCGCCGTTISLSNCSKLRSIGQNAFTYCSGFKSIELSNCAFLNSIGEGAFSSCADLTNIILPTSMLTTIGDFAFSMCSNLSDSIEIPITVTTIGEYVFNGCSNLNKIVLNWTDLSSTNTLNINKDWLGDLNNSNTTILIPKGMMGAYLAKAADWGMDQCTIKEDGTPTYANADKFFTSTTGDTVTGTVCYLDNGDNTITLLPDDSTESHNATTTTSVVGKNLQLDTESTGKIQMPVSDISDDTFRSSNITGALDLSLCTSLTSIGKQAFMSSPDETIRNNITSVKLPGNINMTGFGLAIFLGNNLTKIECTSNDNYEVWQPNKNENGQMLVPKGTNTWTNESFTLGGIACGNVDLSSYKFTKLKWYSFSGSDITNIKLPDGLTELEGDTGDTMGALRACINLTAIDLPTSILKIDPFAFANCINLNSINTDKLQNLTTIGNCAFVYCAGLSNFVIPKSVRSIGANAFGTTVGATKFTSITLQNTNPTWISGIDNDWLAGSYSAIKTIYVPEGCKTAYQNEYAKLYQAGTYDWFKDGMSWEEYTPPAPSDNNLNLGIALGVSLGICIGIPGIVGGISALVYNNKRKKQQENN